VPNFLPPQETPVGAVWFLTATKNRAEKWTLNQVQGDDEFWTGALF
jgi:hypothetical protein